MCIRDSVGVVVGYMDEHLVVRRVRALGERAHHDVEVRAARRTLHLDGRFRQIGDNGFHVVFPHLGDHFQLAFGPPCHDACRCSGLDALESARMGHDHALRCLLYTSRCV